MRRRKVRVPCGKPSAAEKHLKAKVRWACLTWGWQQGLQIRDTDAGWVCRKAALLQAHDTEPAEE